MVFGTINQYQLKPEVDFVIHVTKNGKKYTASSTIMLLPDEN